MSNETEVTVTYRFGKEPPPPPQPQATSEVEIEIYIERVEGGWKFVPAYASLPHGIHRVYWIPRGPDFPEFDALWITQKPPKVNELESPNKLTPTKWTAVYENPGVEGINAIKYEFSGRDNQGARFGQDNFQHDPTIAVTNDPPPGYYSPLGAESGAREAGLAAQRVEEG